MVVGIGETWEGMGTVEDTLGVLTAEKGIKIGEDALGVPTGDKGIGKGGGESSGDQQCLG